MTDTELIQEIEAQRSLMIAVATGGPRIASVNAQYAARREVIAGELAARSLRDPNPYDELWSWYGKWSSGDLPTYQSRREYLSDLYRPLIQRLREGPGVHGARVFEEPTGWAAIDRDLGEMRKLLEQAQSPQQFQAVGLFCRELLLSLAQTVYEREKHPSLDGTEASNADAKRMLDAYIAAELGGGANDELRKHARASLDLANHLQHRRTTTFREATLCAEATTSVANIVAIISGRRDPGPGPGAG